MSNSFVLVINSGSSSLKFAVINSETGEAIVSGLGECFGLPEAEISWKYQGNKTEEAITAPEQHHQHAINRIVALIEEYQLSDKIVAVGHRIVHGGERFTQTVRINQDVLEEIEALADLAPLHNPAGATGIRAAMNAFLLCLNSLYSTLHSIKPCLRKLSQAQSPTSCTKNMVFVDTVSTEPATTM